MEAGLAAMTTWVDYPLWLLVRPLRLTTSDSGKYNK